jgi:hypothetical protein
LTVPVRVAPPPSPVTVALICSLLGWRMTAARVPARRLSALRLLGVLINHGEHSGSRHGARLVPRKGATPEDDARGEDRGCNRSGRAIQQAA